MSLKRAQATAAAAASLRLSRPPVEAEALDLVASQALSRILLADAESGILVLDPRGRIAAINPAACRLFSLAAARVRHRPAREFLRTLVPGDDPVAEAYRVARTERELVLATRQGEEVPVLLRSYRVGSPPSVVLTLRDLTQARRMQEELRRHERLATLGQLSAGVAHEIRNPLGGIGTSAQVLLRRFEPRDERARFVRVILEEVARLDRIVTSLLQYARPRTPELHARALTPCIDRVLELAHEAIQHSAVRAEVTVEPRLPAVYIDADLITQVLLNVTLNAVQAMPQGGTLRYEVRRARRRRPQRSPGRRVTDARLSSGRRAGTWVEFQQVRITDTGAGIPRGILAKLFDPFFSTKPQGSGLGLSICQSIMQEHGGTIEVTSREGHGTTVLLSFPTEKRYGERREPHAHAKRPHAAGR
jgi:PAS domain S-box-containing protein